MKKISIIIPVYCVEKYLKECLDSIFQQTLDEIEVICINDGSNDNSLMVLNQYKKIYNNMIVYTQENSGSGNARNTGIKLAKGKYLMFVDPDDYLAEKDALEALYIAAENNHVDVCGGNLLKKIDNVVSLHNEGLFASYIPQRGIFTFKDYQFAYGHTRYIIKKELLVNNRILYPNYQRGQDIPFMAEVLNAANQFCLIDKDIYVHRKGHKKVYYTEKKADDFIESLYDVLKLAIGNGLSELFDIYVKQINGFAKQVWYAQIYQTNSWEKINRVNQCIVKGNEIFQYDEKDNCLMEKEECTKYILMLEEQRKRLDKIIAESEKIIIYGAGKMGEKILRYLRDRNKKPICFVISGRPLKDIEIDKIPIVSVEELSETRECLFLLSAVDSLAREDMEKRLLCKGYSNILNLDADIYRYLEG